MQAFQHIPLRTRRLILRPLREADAEALFSIFSDAEVMRYWSTPPWKTQDAARTVIAQDLAEMGDTYLRLGVESIEQARLIGHCSLFAINAACRRAELGYGLSSRDWGCGYMQEALSALLDYGFRNLNLNRIEADIDPRNERSARTLKQLGFSKEGYLPQRWIVDGEVSDTVLYGLLRKNWKPR